MNIKPEEEIPTAVTRIAGYLKQTGFADQIDSAIILGSGLGSFVHELENASAHPYSEIPDFPQTSVPGHEGTLYSGHIGPKKVLVFAGRFHHYEGYPIEKTVLPVQLSKALGAGQIIVTNAAGGVNFRFRIGDLMLIDDLIRMGSNLSVNGKVTYQRYYNPDFTDKVRSLAHRHGIFVQTGSYFFAKGPSYETKAEIRAFRTMGADAVGMSTAAELIEAERLGLNSLGISLITNMAAGVSAARLDHSEIKEAAKLREKDFGKLVREIILADIGLKLQL